jgi:hypothetical protein
MKQVGSDTFADINSSSSLTKNRSTSSPSHLLDATSNKALPRWISDLQYAILSRIKEHFVFEPKYLVKWGFAKDGKSAYVYTKRLERLGVIVKSKRGFYQVAHDVVERLLHLPVRMISAGVRLVKGTRVSCLSGVLSLEGYLPKVAGSKPSAKPSRLVLLGPYLRPRYLGLFLDNVRGWGVGRYKQLPRDLLLKPRDLDLFVSNRVSYFEVCHLVGNVLMDGCVVVYTNLEDLDKFGASCRVEYRPPKDFVKDNGLFTLRKGVVELSKAFRAIAVVLRSCLPVDELRGLFSWLSSLWSFALPSPPSSS